MRKDLKLFEFFWDCGRAGELVSIFAATQEEVDRAIGQQAVFGEVLSKHSYIQGNLESVDFKVLTDDAEFIAKANKCGLIPIGYNPLDYAGDDCDWCGENSLDLSEETDRGRLCPDCLERYAGE